MKSEKVIHGWSYIIYWSHSGIICLIHDNFIYLNGNIIYFNGNIIHFNGNIILNHPENYTPNSFSNLYHSC